MKLSKPIHCQNGDTRLPTAVICRNRYSNEGIWMVNKDRFLWAIEKGDTESLCTDCLESLPLLLLGDLP